MRPEPPPPVIAFAEGLRLRRASQKLTPEQCPEAFLIATQELEFGFPFPDPDGGPFPLQDFDSADLAADAWEKEERADQTLIRSAIEDWISTQDAPLALPRTRDFMRMRFQTAARFTKSIPPGFHFDGSYTDLLRTMLFEWWETSGRTDCLLYLLPSRWQLARELGRRRLHRPN